MANVYRGVGATFDFEVYSATTGEPVHGAVVTLSISKDGGVPAAVTNSVGAEQGTTGTYSIALTDAEMTATRIKLTGTCPTGVVESLVIRPEQDLTKLRAEKLDYLTGTAALDSTVAKDATVAKPADVTAARDAVLAAIPVAPDNAGIAAIKAKTDNLPPNTATAIAAIPVNPLLTSDVRLDNLNAPIGSIPTNPLLTTDPRLDAYATQADVAALSVSTFYTPSAYTLNVGTLVAGVLADVATHNDTHLVFGESLTGLDVEFEFITEQVEFPRNVTVYGRYQGSNQHHVDADAWNYISGAWEELVGDILQNAVVDSIHAFSLRPEHVRDSDGQIRIRLLHDAGATQPNASHRLYVDKIEIEKTRAEPNLTLDEIEGSQVLAKEATLQAIPTNPVLATDPRLDAYALDATVAKPGDAMVLTAAYDAAKNAASQASINSLGSPLQASSYVAPDNAGVAAIKAKTDNLPASPASSQNITAAQTAIIAAMPTVPAAADLLDVALTDHLTSGSVGEAIALIKGLVQDNFILDETEYHELGMLTSGRIRLFRSASDANAGLNPLATFRITATTEAAPNSERAATYKVVRE